MQGMFRAAALTALVVAPAYAQTAEMVSDEIVVTGSRGAARTRLETAAPVDIIDAQALRATGFPDLARALQFAAPSLNFPRTVTAPSAALARGFTLRGLAPDQTLVLVNGKRRHASSVLNFNNVIGRGSTSVDLNTIPLSAVERIEVLRDGASAIYGSDAIAGVINIVLRDASSGGSVTVGGGVTDAGDGAHGEASGTVGLPLGDGGFLTLFGEARRAEPTNRAEIDRRFDRVTFRFGNPEALDINLGGNAGLDLASDAHLYASAFYAYRDNETATNFRSPGVSPLFPNGFLPLIAASIDDVSTTVGARGSLGRWRYDVSDSFGYNKADFTVSHTANASLGLASPTTFDAGSTRYTQNTVDVSLSRDLAWLAGGSFSVGASLRSEAYRIGRGEFSSYTGTGAQGFPGLNPPQPVDASRSSYAAFAELGVSPVDRLDLSAAARFESYDDFGEKTTYRGSALLRLFDGVNLRAAASTGFRAPSLAQTFFSTVSSQLVAGQPSTVGTYAVADPIAIALGARPLQAETSRNYSAGLTGRFGGLDVTLDYYSIAINDRIALSDSLRGAAVNSVLAAAGITGVTDVRFFTNAVDTTTTGWDLTGRYRAQISSKTELTLTLAATKTDTNVDRVSANRVIPNLPLVTSTTLLLLTQAQPESRVSLSTELSRGPFSASLGLTRFGEWRYRPVTTLQEFSPALLVDFALRLEVTDKTFVVAGVKNATDEYPNRLVDQGATTASLGASVPYFEASPFGFDGREYFVRLTQRF